MQIESVFRYAVELMQASFGIRPKTFNAVNMRVADNELILRVIDRGCVCRNRHPRDRCSRASRPSERLNQATPFGRIIACFQEDGVGCAPRNAAQNSRLRSIQIHRKMPNEKTEFLPANMRTPIITV